MTELHVMREANQRSVFAEVDLRVGPGFRVEVCKLHTLVELFCHEAMKLNGAMQYSWCRDTTPATYVPNDTHEIIADPY